MTTHESNPEPVERVARPEPSTPAATAIAPRPPSAALDIAAVLGNVEALKAIPVETVTELHRIHRIEVEDGRRVAFHEAFARVQSKMAPVHKAATGDRGSKYAKAEAVCAMLDPLLIAEGFAWSFSDLDSPHPGFKRVTMFLRCAGHEETHYYDAPLWDGKGPKGNAVMTPLQASGAIESYAQRRLRSGVFGVNLVDDLDGANPASAATITEEQAHDIELQLEDLGGREMFLATYGLKSVGELPAMQHRAACALLDAKRRRMEASNG